MLRKVLKRYTKSEMLLTKEPYLYSRNVFYDLLLVVKIEFSLDADISILLTDIKEHVTFLFTYLYRENLFLFIEACGPIHLLQILNRCNKTFNITMAGVLRQCFRYKHFHKKVGVLLFVLF